jgi:hypothetical protein
MLSRALVSLGSHLQSREGSEGAELRSRFGGKQASHESDDLIFPVVAAAI